jgi:ABC-type multidrug transport system fused ATPase/permease subunit
MNSLNNFFQPIVQIVTIIFVLMSVTPQAGFIIPLICYCYYWVAALYLVSSRQLKRLESTSNSPIYAQFSETLNGVSTVRAYSAEGRFKYEIEEKVDSNNRNTFYLWTSNRWLSLRCEILSSSLTAFVGGFILISNISEGWAGLAMIYMFEFTNCLSWIIRNHGMNA